MLYILVFLSFFLPVLFWYKTFLPSKTSTFFFIHFSADALSIYVVVCLFGWLVGFHSKDLTWRDVQHVIIRSARPNPNNLFPNDWITNSANLTGMLWKGRYVPSCYVYSWTCELFSVHDFVIKMPTKKHK